MKALRKIIGIRLHWVHWAIIILSLLLTLSAWYITKQKTDQQSENSFDLETQQIVWILKQRMQKYEDALWSAAAHITVLNNKIDEKSWRKYAMQLNLTEKYPGINGIGVIYSIKRSDLNSYIAEKRKTRKYFKIFPAHNNERLFPIVYIEPYESNKEAVGLDMAHEINRYTAAIKTEISGKPQITGPITLVQDKKRTPGFLLFVPLYSKVEKHKLIGLVYAPFIMYKLMSGSLGDNHMEVSLTIKDEGKLIYRDDKNNADKIRQPRYQKIISESIYGRVWDINFRSTRLFDKNNVSQEPIYILIGGITVDILLLLLFLTLKRANRKAILYANMITEDLKDKTEALDKLAYYDELTGLPNRTGFFMTLEACLKQAKKRNNTLALCIIDIDDFKRVNDSRGYEAGDDFLSLLALSFDRIKLPGTYIARLGADEFGLILETVRSENELLERLEIYHRLTSSPEFIEQSPLPASLSIGAAMYPSAGKTAKSLYISADIANNAAKDAGKNQYVIFNENLNHKVKRQHELDFGIRRALRNEELFLVYQPQIDLNTHELVGFEALLRWHSGLLGDISPTEFIPIAEKNSVILKIGRWLVKQVCLDLEKFKLATNRKNLTVSLNSSIVEILHPSYIKNFKKAFKETSIKENELCIEVTESVLMEDPAKIIGVLNELRLLGITISLDDFGTGYSSLKHLKDLPVSTLKIDKSFIDDITTADNRSIVENVMQLARSLNLTVLAEGAETEEQIAELKSMDCDLVQGYYFYKPLPLADAIDEFKIISDESKT